jgi:hypothetical protein
MEDGALSGMGEQTMTLCQSKLIEITKKPTTPKAVMVVMDKYLSEYQVLSVPIRYGEISIIYSHISKDKKHSEVVN